MRCPKCGYSSFGYLDECRRCSADLVEFKTRYKIWALKPGDINFLYAEGAETGLGEQLAAVAVAPSPAEQPKGREAVEEGELELVPLELSKEPEPAGMESTLAGVDLGEPGAVAGMAEEAAEAASEAREPVRQADLAGGEGEIELPDLARALGDLAREDAEAVADLSATGRREVSEEEVLKASGDIDMSDLEQEMSLEEVLREVAGGEPEEREVPVTELEEPTEADILSVTLPLDLGATEKAPPAAEESHGVDEEAPPKPGSAEGLVERPAKEPRAREGDARPVSLDMDALERELAAEERRAEAGEEPAPRIGGRELSIDDDLLREASEGKLPPPPVIDLSALEDVDLREVTAVEEEEESAEEAEGLPRGSEAAPEEIGFEFDEDWLGKKEEDEEKKGE